MNKNVQSISIAIRNVAKLPTYHKFINHSKPCSTIFTHFTNYIQLKSYHTPTTFATPTNRAIALANGKDSFQMPHQLKVQTSINRIWALIWQMIQFQSDNHTRSNLFATALVSSS